MFLLLSIPRSLSPLLPPDPQLSRSAIPPSPPLTRRMCLQTRGRSGQSETETVKTALDSFTLQFAGSAASNRGSPTDRPIDGWTDADAVVAAYATRGRHCREVRLLCNQLRSRKATEWRLTTRSSRDWMRKIVSYITPLMSHIKSSFIMNESPLLNGKPKLII